MSPAAAEEATRVAHNLLGLWAQALETDEGRELVSDALCRALRSVSGCAGCPHQGTLRELAATLDGAARQSAALTGLVEQAEFLAERLVPPRG